MMKYLVSIIAGVGLALGAAMVFLPSPATNEEKVSSKVLGNVVTFFATPTPAYGIPETIKIPSLGVDAKIERVGMTETGAMDVPKESKNVAWYQLGPKPGNLGSAVIAGHYDWYDGPSIFYNLGKLKSGDEIITTDEGGREARFKVTDTKIYEDANFPIEEVFSKFDRTRLNLITCNGTFNRSSKNYDKRLVVFSERIN